jgi:hypothetical protein
MQIIFILTSLVALAFAKDCNTGSAAGTANGECVGFYSGGSCTGELGSFQPTCEGNCFQFSSFNSLSVAGDGTFGTDCEVFSDTNCQTSMGDTGNQVVGPEKCLSFPGAQSMQCFYRC